MILFKGGGVGCLVTAAPAVWAGLNMAQLMSLVDRDCQYEEDGEDFTEPSQRLDVIQKRLSLVTHFLFNTVQYKHYSLEQSVL